MRSPATRSAAPRLPRRPAVFALACLACFACATGELVDWGAYRAGLAVHESRTVRLRAVFRGWQGCLPCPQEAGAMVACQPCVSTLGIAEAVDSPEAEILWMAAPDPGLVVGRRYTFTVRVRPGYRDKPLDRYGNPLFWSGPPPVEFVGAD